MRTACLLVLVGLLAAADGEGGVIPTPPEEQWAIFTELALKCQVADARRDEAGNVIFVRLEQSPYREPPPEHPGLSPDDLARFRHFPALEAVSLRGQLLPDSAYQVLGELPELRVVNLSDVLPDENRRPWPEGVAKPSGEYIRFLERVAPRLEILDLEHSFRIDASIFPELPPMPELRHLCVDTVHAAPDLLGFLEGCPNLRSLRLHRTTFGNEDVARAAGHLPRLEFLYLKPSRGLDHRALAGLAGYPSLRALRLSSGMLPLPWDDGLEHLLAIPGLEIVSLPTHRNPDLAPDPADLERLQRERPELTVADGSYQSTVGYQALDYRDIPWRSLSGRSPHIILDQETE